MTIIVSMVIVMFPNPVHFPDKSTMPEFNLKFYEVLIARGYHDAGVHPFVEHIAFYR
jgi:hypothetical protein